MQKQRLRERLPKCISAAKFGPRFRADTLTFLLSLWKPGVPGIEVYFENESTPSRAFGKYTWYRATRCGVNPKSNRSAVKFRARARYMQWVPVEPEKSPMSKTRRDEWKTSAGEKEQTGKLTEGTSRAKIQSARFQKEPDINAVDYNAPSSLFPAPETRQYSSSVKRRDDNARLLRRPMLKVPFTYRAKTLRG